MAKSESQGAGDLDKQRSQVAPSVPEKPAATAADVNGGETVTKRASGPTELPPRFGRYRVIKKLGGGGMGTVYLVENIELEREEALKVPHFSDGDDPQLRERFLREAKSAAKMEHANLCPIYDAGVQDGIYYLTMRFLKGKLLSDYTGKAQPSRKAVEIVAKLAQALEAAHAKGIIHRDLKPSNIMMVSGTGPVVMDFGLAKQVRQSDQKLTQDGSMLGTPAYMPPEQLQGELDRMGPASDVYSLGVILYELLTGRLPFEGTTAMIFGQILYTEPSWPSELVAELDPTLDEICQKAMAKESTERYASMKTFAAALLDYLRSTPAAEGAGSLAPNVADNAAVFQAPTVAPGRKPAGNSDIFRAQTVVPQARRSPPPTLLGAKAPSASRPAKGARKTTPKTGTTGDEGQRNRHILIGLAAGAFLAILGLGVVLVIRGRHSSEPDTTTADSVERHVTDASALSDLHAKAKSIRKPSRRANSRSVPPHADGTRTATTTDVKGDASLASAVRPAPVLPNENGEKPAVPGQFAAGTEGRDRVRNEPLQNPEPPPVGGTGFQAPTQPIAAATKGALDGIWNVTTGGTFRIEDAGNKAQPILLTLLTVTDEGLVGECRGELIGREAQSATQSWHGSLLAQFKNDREGKPYTIPTTATLDALGHLHLHCATWPIFSKRGKRTTFKTKDFVLIRNEPSSFPSPPPDFGRPGGRGAEPGRPGGGRSLDFDRKPTNSNTGGGTGSLSANAAGAKPTQVRRSAVNPSPFAGHQPGEQRLDSGSILPLVWIPAGVFRMGSEMGVDHKKNEGPIDVNLTYGFWMGKYEVTRSQWQRVMHTNPWETQTDDLNPVSGGNYPATHIDWDNAIAFCRKLTEDEHRAGRLPSDWEYSLPTEAQWEYACRAGTSTLYYCGKAVAKLLESAWFKENLQKDYERHAQLVGSRAPNPWGLYDMHGNVSEWCRDWYAPDLPGGPDPEVASGSGRKCIRGGNWRSTAEDLRSAARSSTNVGMRSSAIGFRVVAVLVGSSHLPSPTQATPNSR
jgi:serine/threonine protein kinase/formylglycine-generating enzyme required for sulfatase activity